PARSPAPAAHRGGHWTDHHWRAPTRVGPTRGHCVPCPLGRAVSGLPAPAPALAGALRGQSRDRPRPATPLVAGRDDGARPGVPLVPAGGGDPRRPPGAATTPGPTRRG